MMQTPARGRMRGTARGQALANPNIEGPGGGENVSDIGKESLPRMCGAHQKTPVQYGARVVTLARSTMATHKRADAPPPAAAGPPVPAAVDLPTSTRPP
jgi:hypothetical protein